MMTMADFDDEELVAEVERRVRGAAPLASLHLAHETIASFRVALGLESDTDDVEIVRRVRELKEREERLVEKLAEARRELGQKNIDLGNLRGQVGEIWDVFLETDVERTAAVETRGLADLVRGSRMRELKLDEKLRARSDPELIRELAKEHKIVKDERDEARRELGQKNIEAGHLKGQVEALGRFVDAEGLREPSRVEEACECAVRIMRLLLSRSVPEKRGACPDLWSQAYAAAFGGFLQTAAEGEYSLRLARGEVEREELAKYQGAARAYALLVADAAAASVRAGDRSEPVGVARAFADDLKAAFVRTCSDCGARVYPNVAHACGTVLVTPMSEQAVDEKGDAERIAGAILPPLAFREEVWKRFPDARIFQDSIPGDDRFLIRIEMGESAVVREVEVRELSGLSSRERVEKARKMAYEMACEMADELEKKLGRADP